MGKDKLGLVIAGVGLILALVAATADVFGTGEGEGFGPYQMWGTIIGVLLLVVGMMMSRGAKQ